MKEHIEESDKCCKQTMFLYIHKDNRLKETITVSLSKQKVPKYFLEAIITGYTFTYSLASVVAKWCNIHGTYKYISCSMEGRGGQRERGGDSIEHLTEN